MTEISIHILDRSLRARIVKHAREEMNEMIGTGRAGRYRSHSPPILSPLFD